MSVTLFSAVIDRGVVVPITLEFSASHHGLPGISFVGTPRSSLSETRERVLATFRSMKLQLPRAKVTINMLPVDVPKQGSSLDLAIALGLLMLHGVVPEWQSIGVIGELGLSGEIRNVVGLPLLVDELSALSSVVFTPREKKALSLVSQPHRVLPCSQVSEVLAHLQRSKEVLSLANDGLVPDWWESSFQAVSTEGSIPRSLAEILSFSLVGGHHLLVYGSPGIGKSHMKSYLPSLLPPLTHQEMRKRALSGSLHDPKNDSYSRVLAPHTSATIPGLLGGGSPFRPGALQQADQGVLFLDELPEFRIEVLESLRQPLEEEGITLVRSGRSFFVPCSCTVIATANPCPCGYFGEKKCTCSFSRVQQYLHRLSGPLLDRFAFQYRFPSGQNDQIPLSEPARSIAKGRVFQRERSEKHGFPVWARLYTQEHLQELGAWKASETQGLSLRRRMHLGQVARTIADVRLSEQIRESDWEQARSLVDQSWY